MNKSDLKNAIERLEPDQGLEHRLAEELKSSRKKVAFKPALAIAAGLAVMLCAGFYATHLPGTVPGENHGNAAKSAGVYIPKPELSGNTKMTADMVGLIVYQGRIYLQSTQQLSPEIAEGMRDQKIGKTKGNITEWSKQEDYSKELASTVGIQDVYTVKGYDKSFRIMTCETIDGMVNAQFYECVNGITVKTGADIFAKLKMKGNEKSARYELFESWNNSRQEYKPLVQLGGLKDFLTALDASIPYGRDSMSDLWGDQSADCQKFVYILLKDGTEVQLRIFKGGYVYYNNIFFKMDNTAFTSFWNELE